MSGLGRQANQDRLLPLGKKTAGVLVTWLAIRPEVSDQHIFLNKSGRGMTRLSFATQLDLHVATAARAEPSIARRKVTPHVKRHAWTLNIFETTGDIRRISLWLGHQSLQTTEMYLRADPAEKLRTVSKWRSPGLGKGWFTGVKDELMAKLTNF